MQSESKTIIGTQYAKVFETAKWYKILMDGPLLELPPDCGIRILPPYLGAIVRFNVVHKTYGISINVQLICYDWGISEDPYWQIGDDITTYKIGKIADVNARIIEALRVKIEKQHPFGEIKELIKQADHKKKQSWFWSLFS